MPKPIKRKRRAFPNFHFAWINLYGKRTGNWGERTYTRTPSASIEHTHSAYARQYWHGIIVNIGTGEVVANSFTVAELASYHERVEKHFFKRLGRAIRIRKRSRLPVWEPGT